MGYRLKRGNIRRNAAQGRRVESIVRRRYERKGFKVQCTGRGHDFKATRYGSAGGKFVKFVEVKSGNAKLSPTQRRAKRRLGPRYAVERVAAGWW